MYLGNLGLKQLDPFVQFAFIEAETPTDLHERNSSLACPPIDGVDSETEVFTGLFDVQKSLFHGPCRARVRC